MSNRLQFIGMHVTRVLVLPWIGGMKFTAYEAENQAAGANNPLMGRRRLRLMTRSKPIPSFLLWAENLHSCQIMTWRFP